MNEARVYADGFERSFAEVKDLLEFLAERGRNAKWIRKPTNTLRLAPLEKEAQNLDAADASMEEILEDTEKNTQLVLKMRGESYPVRDCAIRTILSRAGVNGDGLRKLDKATYAKVVNYCLRVAKGDALIKIADGKVSAVHGGDKHDYCILDMKAMFETTCEYLNLNFKGSVYMEGSGIYDHSIVYYLHHLFSGESNINGSIFVDCHNQPDFTDQNTIVYGHNMKNGSMFGTLDKYQDKELFEQHPEFYLYLPDKILKYRIFSCYAGRTGSEGYRYHFPEAEDFQTFLDTVSSYRDYDTGTELSATDRIVTLSTCVNSRRNYRYLVHGKLSSEIITEE